MRSQLFAAIEFHVSEKSFVSFDERGGHQRGEVHRPTLWGRSIEFKRLDISGRYIYLHTMTKRPSAALLIIGDEILSGRTRDANLQTIAVKLSGVGVDLAEVRVVPDDEAVIVAALNALRPAHKYVFTTGGIGPTHDDITATCVARAFGVPIDVRADAYAILEAHYPPGEFNETRQRMARIPDGATLIPNPISKAPGFQLENVFVLPGIPMLVEVMLDGLLESLVGGPPLYSHTISAFVPESVVAKGLEIIQDRYPALRIGSYPFLRDGKAGASLVLRGTDESALENALQDLRELIAGLNVPIELDARG